MCVSNSVSDYASFSCMDVDIIFESVGANVLCVIFFARNNFYYPLYHAHQTFDN